MGITQLKITEARNLDGSGVLTLPASIAPHLIGIDVNNGGVALLINGKKELLRRTLGSVFWETYIPLDYQEGDNPAVVINAHFNPGTGPSPQIYTASLTARVVLIKSDGSTDGRNLIYTASSTPINTIPTDYTFTVNGTDFVSGTKLLVYATVRIDSTSGDTTGTAARINSAHYDDTYLIP